jgi:hypothetical protein
MRGWTGGRPRSSRGGVRRVGAAADVCATKAKGHGRYVCQNRKQNYLEVLENYDVRVELRSPVALLTDSAQYGRGTVCVVDMVKNIYTKFQL